MESEKYLEAIVLDISNECIGSHNQGTEKIVHIMGDSYFAQDASDPPYRFVEYTFAYIPLKEILEKGMPNGDWYAEFKQYIQDCTEEELIEIYEHYDNGNMPTAITALTEDLPCGCYILLSPTNAAKEIKKICVTDIEWDAPKSAKLPRSVTINVNHETECLLDDIDGYADSLSDYLSNTYGYCHKGFAVTCE